MVENQEINGTDEIGLVTPTPVQTTVEQEPNTVTADGLKSPATRLFV